MSVGAGAGVAVGGAVCVGVGAVVVVGASLGVGNVDVGRAVAVGGGVCVTAGGGVRAAWWVGAAVTEESGGLPHAVTANSSTANKAVVNNWIPAFAGMTACLGMTAHLRMTAGLRMVNAALPNLGSDVADALLQ